MGKRRSSIFILVFAAAAASLAPAAIAQDYLPVDLLTSKSTTVGVGKVRSETTRRDPDNGMIYTDYTLKITDLWKGDAPTDPFILTQAGGLLDGKIVMVPGHDFRLKVGESIVFFTHPNKMGTNAAIGIHQGLFQIDPGPRQFVHRILGPNSERRSPLTLLQMKEQVFRASGRPWEGPLPPPVAPPSENTKPYGSAALPGGAPAEPDAPARPGEPSRPVQVQEPAGNFGSMIGAGMLILAAAAFVFLRKLRARSHSE